MKLNEKIYSLRKRLGLSQEDLASVLNVSRQSISNWETGAANPEIGKLTQLAETLGVSVDFLLDEKANLGDPKAKTETKTETTATSEDKNAETTNDSKESTTDKNNRPLSRASREYPYWLDKFPGFLKSSVLRYGWLYGIRLALSGFIAIAFGFIGRTMIGAFFNQTAMGFGDSLQFSDGDLPFEVTRSVENHLGIQAPNSGFMSIIPNAVIIFGVILVIGGLILAYALKKWGKRQLEDKNNAD